MQNKPESVRSNVEESIEDLVCCAHLPVLLVMMVWIIIRIVSFRPFTFQLEVILTLSSYRYQHKSLPLSEPS